MIFHQLQLMVCAMLARRYALGQFARTVPTTRPARP
jgi:predicted Na+-dependent transporter